MPISLNDSGKALINKILVAESQQEVKQCIDNLLGKMKQRNDSAANVAGFVDSTVHHLENLNPMDKDAMQWSNIKMARIHLQHIKRALDNSLQINTHV